MVVFFFELRRELILIKFIKNKNNSKTIFYIGEHSLFVLFVIGIIYTNICLCVMESKYFISNK